MMSRVRLAVSRALLGGSLCFGCLTLASAQEPEAALPGGATSLSERHGDWTVGCEVRQKDGKAVKACAISQRQANDKGQTLITIELRPAGEGVSGLLVLPFGVAVTKSASLVIDEVEHGPALPFSTCIPSGCLVPLTLDATIVAALRIGKALTVSTPTSDGGKINLRISLTGFSNALARVTELLN